MAKKFKPCKCVHCLVHCNKPTSDHVFPQSWYPETAPKNIEKWQIPSCTKCNSEYSKIEDDLLRRFGMCVDPASHAAKGISDKALRSVDPERGRSDKDKECRFKSRLELLQNLIPHEYIDYNSVLPSRKPLPESDKSTGILIPADSIKRMGIKLIRGITYVTDNLYIDNDHVIDLFFVHDINAQEFIHLIKQHGKRYDRGQGIIVERASAPDDPQVGLYYIEIWNQLYMYGTVTLKESG